MEKQYRGAGAAQHQLEEMHSGSKSEVTAIGKANATLTSMLESQVNDEFCENEY